MGLLWKALLLFFDHSCKRLSVRNGEFEIVVGIRIVVNSNGHDVSDGGTTQRVSTLNYFYSVTALDVVIIEGIGSKAVLARNERNSKIQRYLSSSLQHVTMPHFH